MGPAVVVRSTGTKTTRPSVPRAERSGPDERAPATTVAPSSTSARVIAQPIPLLGASDGGDLATQMQVHRLLLTFSVQSESRCALDLQPEHGLGTYHKVRVEGRKLNWADTLMLVRESPPGWCKPAVSTAAHGPGPRAANSAGKQLESEGGPLQRASKIFHRCGAPNTSRPSDTVS
jgi:hypothetical protein